MQKIDITNYEHSNWTGLKVAVVSDTHGEDPESIILNLKEIQPDIIIFAGDILERICKKKNISNKYKAKARPSVILAYKILKFARKIKGTKGNQKIKDENAYRLLMAASQIAPSFMSPGNHEMYYTDEDRKRISECGVVLLDGDYTEVLKERYDGKLRSKLFIGGMGTDELMNDRLCQLAKEDGYRILICHRPINYIKQIKGKYFDTYDLVVAGHAHGGQWRIGERGVFSPDEGLFPKYTAGQHKKMVISRGIANTVSIPRINNKPEIVVIKT